MLRKASVIIGIAAAHFVAAKIIVTLTMQMGMFAADGSRAAGVIGHLLVWITRVLYFPVISLSLYSRQWFPGNWISVPMIANSLLWGMALYGIYCLLIRRR
jgi:hypothetical protein